MNDIIYDVTGRIRILEIGLHNNKTPIIGWVIGVLHNSFTYPFSESDRTGVAGFFKAKPKRILGHILICENTSEMSRARLA